MRSFAPELLLLQHRTLLTEINFIQQSSRALFTHVVSFQIISRYYKKQFALNIRRAVCTCVLKNMVSSITPVMILDWKEFPSRILIIIVEYLFFEFLALFLRSPYYATSALNFKCDKQSMSVGGRWLMTSSDRAFKPALFSEERYFHVNLLCVLQRWDKSPAHKSGKVETTRRREGPWLDSFRLRGERALGDFPHLQGRGPVSHFALCQLEKDESAPGIPWRHQSHCLLQADIIHENRYFPEAENRCYYECMSASEVWVL